MIEIYMVALNLRRFSGKLFQTYPNFLSIILFYCITKLKGVNLFFYINLLLNSKHITFNFTVLTALHSLEIVQFVKHAYFLT
jgi:hypothetical protein